MGKKLDENLMKFYKVDKYKKAVAKDLAARGDKKRSTSEIGDALVAGVL